MSELMVFDFESNDIRTQSIDGDPWFIGKDVTDVLGYSNANDAIARHVDDEDKGVAFHDTLGGKQNLVIINESGLYSLIIKSKLPSSKRFKRWVTSEVLPAIRKTGKYEVPMSQEDIMIATLKIQKELREKVDVIEEDVAYLKEEQPISPYPLMRMESLRRKKVVAVLGGKSSNAYKKLSNKVFAEAGRDFKNKFGIPRYDMLPKKYEEQGLEYWGDWEPCTNTKLEIKELNSQISLEV